MTIEDAIEYIKSLNDNRPHDMNMKCQIIIKELDRLRWRCCLDETPDKSHEKIIIQTTREITLGFYFEGEFLDMEENKLCAVSWRPL